MRCCHQILGDRNVGCRTKRPKSAPTGCATRALLTPSISAHPYTWFNALSAIVRWRRRPATCIAGPMISSAGYLAAETFLRNSVTSTLLSKRPRVMDGMTAARAAKGDYIMTSVT